MWCNILSVKRTDKQNTGRKLAMEKIINILMKRDGLSFEEARRQCEDTVAEVRMAIASGDFLLAEELMMSDLGLEPDYLMDIL
jgi:hypothetical protein